MSVHSHANNSEQNCKCRSQTAVQCLGEMDFERGIWSAALHNELPRLEKFIDKGCTNDQDNSGYTALHYAARNGHFDACKILVQAEAELDAVTNGGVTSLHRAAMMGHSEIVRLLLDANASAAICDQDGQNPLHRAAFNGHVAAARLLVEKDNSLKFAKDHGGKLPFDLSPDSPPELKRLLSVDFK